MVLNPEPVLRVDPASDYEAESLCNCHPIERRPAVVVARLGNTGSSHDVRLCADSLGALYLAAERALIRVGLDAAEIDHPAPDVELLRAIAGTETTNLPWYDGISCLWCYEPPDEHDPACPWLRARSRLGFPS